MSALLATAAVLAVTLVVAWLFSSSAARKSLPPGPAPVPVLGNILSLGADTHHGVAAMARKYGDLMTLWFGAKPAIILSSPSIVNEALVKHGTVYSSRPSMPLTDLILEGYFDLAFCPYNDQWKKMRRLVHQVLNVQAVQTLRLFVEEESTDMVEGIKELNSSLRPRPYFKRMSLNIVLRFCFGDRYGRDMKNPDLVEIVSLADQLLWLCGPQPANFLPWLRYVPVANNIFSYATDLKNRRNVYLDKKIDGVRAQIAKEKEQGVFHANAGEYDPRKLSFVKALLLNEDPEDQLNTVDLRFLAVDLIMAGIDTSSTTIEWATYLLANHPKIQQRLFEEIDRVVGKDRLPSVDDIDKLPFLQATVQEVFRYRPVAPLGVPHCTSEDHNLKGYTIPKDTTVMVSIYGINFNPEYFPEPEVFNPERFLNWKAGDSESTSKKPNNPTNVFIFGTGRRFCVGMHLGNMEVQLAVAKLVHQFELRTTNGKPAPLEEFLGLAMRPTVETEIDFIPRG